MILVWQNTAGGLLWHQFDDNCLDVEYKQEYEDVQEPLGLSRVARKWLSIGDFTGNLTEGRLLRAFSGANVINFDPPIRIELAPTASICW